MAIARRSRFYYPLLGVAAALLAAGLVVGLLGVISSRAALYVFVAGSLVGLVANVREWRFQHGRQHA